MEMESDVSEISPHRLVISERDPTKKDVIEEFTTWVSVEYIPYRIFQGKKGKWIFSGKFSPVIKK